jgi:hypothetical protein
MGNSLSFWQSINAYDYRVHFNGRVFWGQSMPPSSIIKLSEMQIVRFEVLPSIVWFDQIKKIRFMKNDSCIGRTVSCNGLHVLCFYVFWKCLCIVLYANEVMIIQWLVEREARMSSSYRSVFYNLKACRTTCHVINNSSSSVYCTMSPASQPFVVGNFYIN